MVRKVALFSIFPNVNGLPITFFSWELWTLSAYFSHISKAASPHHTKPKKKTVNTVAISDLPEQ